MLIVLSIKASRKDYSPKSHHIQNIRGQEVQEAIDNRVGKNWRDNIDSRQGSSLSVTDTVVHINQTGHLFGDPPLDLVEVALNGVGIVKREYVNGFGVLLEEDGENPEHILSPSIVLFE